MKKQNKEPVSAIPKGPLARRFFVEAARDRKVSNTIEAEPDELTQLTEFLGVSAVSRLRATFEIAPLSRGRFDVTGKVTARLIQNCVVSLEDFEVEISEPIEAIFALPADEIPYKIKGKPVIDVSLHDSDDPPDPVIDGAIDLGALALEFVTLALDPHPRKPQVAFEPGVEAQRQPSPFSVLAKLKPN